ncbi:MAG TPA: rRNA maturation RNase YbeY [Myxococcota bacterium]|jgi:probable rRNA maturation factor
MATSKAKSRGPLRLLLLGQRLLRDDKRACLRLARRVVRAANIDELEVGLTFVHDLEMRALNRAWRHKDEPTDVLSFPAHDGTAEAVIGDGEALGDLVISVDTARRQARTLGHSLDTEIAVLVAHGLCHLAGLDHERGPGDAAVQIGCERTLLAIARVDVSAALSARSH